ARGDRDPGCNAGRRAERHAERHACDNTVAQSAAHADSDGHASTDPVPDGHALADAHAHAIADGGADSGTRKRHPAAQHRRPVARGGRMQQRRSARAHRTASHPAVQRTAPLPTIGAAATTARWRDRLATGPSSPLAAAAILITAGLLAAVLAFGAFQAVTWLTADDRHGSAHQAAAPESTRATIYTIAPGRPTPTPAAPPPGAIADEPGDAPDSPGPSDAGIARFVIPDLGVDAPVVVKGLDAHRVMEAPEQPHEVAWYHFTSFPGRPGNAVFS